MPTWLSYLTHDETLYIRPATFAESWIINGKETKPSTHVGFVEFNDMKKFDEEYTKIQVLKSTDPKKKKLGLLDIIGKFDSQETAKQGFIAEYCEKDQFIRKKRVKEIRIV